MLNLIQIQERLKDMPMQAIMQYANGANPQVPPFLALGELNRRKKMQEAAAAEQAQEMAGAPTVKEQIEQATGIMALQKPQAPQAPQGQMPPQGIAAAPQAPVQMAGGGLAQRSQRERDLIARLKMLSAFNRPGGIDQLPISKEMFRRKDYAGGGIVAFAGTDGSFVETSPGFYEQKPAEEEIDESKLSPYERMMYRRLKQRETEPSLQERRRAAGLPDEAPDTTARARAELARREQELQKSDTFLNRLLALQPGKFGSGKLGSSMLEYEKSRQAKMDEIKKLQADAEDRKANAEILYKQGFFNDAEKERREAMKDELEIIAKMSGIKRDEANIRQSDASARAVGRTRVEEQVYADLGSNDPARVAKAKAYLGQAKTGEMTIDRATREWNDMTEMQRARYDKMNPPVTNPAEYMAYLARQRALAEKSGNQAVDYSGWGQPRVKKD